MEFGSYLMDLFNARCDLALSINFRDHIDNADRSVQVKTLQKFADKLLKLQGSGHVLDVELVLSARVPVLKVTDSGTRVECDLSVGNLDGIMKSQIILMISAIDERFPKLCILKNIFSPQCVFCMGVVSSYDSFVLFVVSDFLLVNAHSVLLQIERMKDWAKANNINNAKDGTINSFSLILLVALHLQTRDVPILPPFSDILKDGWDPEAVNKNIRDFLTYGENNKESLAKLFVTMLIKLEAVNPLWSHGLCASTFEGSWISKKLGSFSIEDFGDRSQNSCRALKRKNRGMPKVKSERVSRPKKHKSRLQRLVQSYSGKENSERQAESGPAQSEEKSEIPKKTCLGNITETRNVSSASDGGVDKSQSEEKSGIPKKFCPGNITGTRNVSSSSDGGVDKSQSEKKSGIPKKFCPGNIMGTRNVSSSSDGGVDKSQSEEKSGIPKKICPGNITGTRNVSSTSDGRIDKSHNGNNSHAGPSTFMPGNPHSVSQLPFQGSAAFGNISAGTSFSFPGIPPHVFPHFPAGQVCVGYRQHFDHFRQAPNFPDPGCFMSPLSTSFSFSPF